MESDNKSSIYFDNNRKKYVVSYYIKNKENGKSQRVRQSFKTEEEAKTYQKEVEYKSGNSIFIKKEALTFTSVHSFHLIHF